MYKITFLLLRKLRLSLHRFSRKLQLQLIISASNFTKTGKDFTQIGKETWEVQAQILYAFNYNCHRAYFYETHAC